MRLNASGNYHDIFYFDLDDPVYDHVKELRQRDPDTIIYEIRPSEALDLSYVSGHKEPNNSADNDELKQLTERLDRVGEWIEKDKAANKQMDIDLDRIEKEMEELREEGERSDAAIEWNNNELLKITRGLSVIYRGVLLDLALNKLTNYEFVNIDNTPGPRTLEEIIEHVRKALTDDEGRTELSREAIQCIFDPGYFPIEEEAIAIAISDPMLSVAERKILEEIYFWVYRRHPVIEWPSIFQMMDSEG